MVFLEDVVNLPMQQITNIWMAAHFRKKLKKKDINKTKLGEACEQLHTSKTKKPIQLRHYGQCLVGISWLHFKQVEFLHNDCNEAFTKLKIAFRKRNVDLDSSKDRARDITLPEQRQNDDGDMEDGAINLNLSQILVDDDIDEDIGSLLGSISHSGDGASKRGHLDAPDHEITMADINDITIDHDGRR
eukprot:240217_1